MQLIPITLCAIANHSPEVNTRPTFAMLMTDKEMKAFIGVYAPKEKVDYIFYHFTSIARIAEIPQNQQVEMLRKCIHHLLSVVPTQSQNH